MDLKRTAFDRVQRELGASWTDWEGWAWAADFGDPHAEHQATRTACNVWDESPLRKWDMRGRDALALADALYTNDMGSLEIGQVRYGAICDQHGKMIMDGTVFHVAEHHCFSITSYDSDLEWFRQVASDPASRLSSATSPPTCPTFRFRGRLRGRCCARSPPALTSTRSGTSGS
jgi:aminomethyltransferase